MCLKRINRALERLVGNNKLKVSLLTATSLAVLCLPPTVSADTDDKVYPGSGCVPERGNQPPTAQFIYPFGAIQNLGDRITVNCLIVRDNTLSTGLARVTVRLWSGGVTFPEPSDLDDLVCGVWAFSKLRRPLDIPQPPNLQRLFTKPLNSVRLELNTGDIAELTIENIDDLNASFDQGEFVLFCQLPKDMAVVSYLVSEKPNR